MSHSLVQWLVLHVMEALWMCPVLQHQLGPRDHADNALCQAQVSVLGGSQQESQHVDSDFQQSLHRSW